MLSHLDDDGPVRLDNVKLGVCEVMGLEIDEPKLGAFAGALNALDFPVQLLIRQHPPRLGSLRDRLQEAQPDDLPPQTKAAAESLRRLLTDLETRDGILDRRFYAVCEFARIDDLRGLLARAGLSVHPLRGRQLRMFLVSALLGGSPSESWTGTLTVEVEINRRDMRINGSLVRSLHLGKWPRSLAPGFLQGLMSAGAPMDLSVHIGPIPAEQAARTLEWQKVRFESAQSLSFKKGRTMSPEAEIALEDVTRLRDEVQRGRERLFHSSLSVTLHARDEASLKEMTQRAKAHFGATLGKLDNLAFRQREGLLSTLPLALNAVAEWRSLDTSSASPDYVPLLAARSRHTKRHPLRHRHAGLLPGGLRPLGRHASQCEHGGIGALRLRQELLNQTRSSSRPVPGRDRLRHRPRGGVRRHGPRCGRTRALPRGPRRGHEPLRHRQGRLRGDAPAHRQPPSPDRGHGGGESRRGAQGIPRPRPGGLLRPAPRAHRLPRFLQVSAGERGGRPRPRAAAQALRHRQPPTPSFRRGRRPPQQRGPGHRLRPATARTRAPARRRDGLHRDGVGRSSPGPQAPPARRGRGVEHHAAPRGRRLHGLDGEAGEEAPAGFAVHHPGRAGPPLRGLFENHHRPFGKGAPPERRLQAPAPAGRRRHKHGRRRLRPARRPPAMAAVMPAWRRAPACAGANASPSASRPPRRRRRSSSGDREATRERTSFNHEAEPEKHPVRRRCPTRKTPSCWR